MRIHRAIVLISLGALLASALLWPAQRKKKEKERATQKLEILPNPPAVVSGETARLVFDVAPPRTKGLLSKQVRDSLKVLLKSNRRSGIVKLRAFVAGSGDTRRVQSVVSEFFSDRRLPLPALSVVQVGALPVEGAQVVLESVAEARKPSNPHGLAFISGQAVSSEETTLAVAPLAVRSLEKIQIAIESLELTPAEVLRVTCFCSSLQDGNQVRRAMLEAFPSAALSYVQLRREYTTGSVECEAVARLLTPVSEPLRFVNPDGLEKPPHYSQIALVSARRVALTGTQLAFRYEDSDIRLAFQRLGRVLEEAGASYSGVAVSNIYPLSRGIAEKIRAFRFEFFDKSRPPASTMLELEGLPSLDASFAVEVVAVIPG